ncbi:hypothetical protein DWX11_06000 [Ruminococcus sp. AF18-29]|nr:hypothetical protein DWX11_06000 [Ruminococcus sp. AF18-29]
MVFAPEYLRKSIYGKPKKGIRAILRGLCKQNHVKTIQMIVEMPSNQRIHESVLGLQ